MLKDLEAILFDLDGTMWNSEEEVCNTWNQVVAKHPECRKGPITLEELKGCFGLPMTKIAEKLFSEVSSKEQQIIMDECCELENSYLNEHGAKLYPKLEETLMELKKKYKLFVVSNCQQGYIESFIHAHHLEKCFDDTQSWGDNPVSKGENNQVIMKRNGVTKAVYVGDTAGDEQSARDVGIPFIFCAYGFGQAKSPDAIINSFEELKDILL